MIRPHTPPETPEDKPAHRGEAGGAWASPWELVLEWLDAPPRLLAPLLVRAAEATGAFRVVLLAPAGAATSWRLDTELLRLQQHFSGAGPSQVRLTLRAVLVDAQSRAVLASREFDASVPAALRGKYAAFAQAGSQGMADRFTTRQGDAFEVLEAMAYGLSNSEIAAKFHVSETTVKTHVGRVLSKTHSRDRVQAVVFAFQIGLVRRADLLGTEG